VFSRIASFLIVWPIILVIFAIALLRVGLLQVNYIKSDIETWLNAELIPGLSFGQIEGQWRNLNPVLVLHQATFNPSEKMQAVQVDWFEIELSALESLVTGELVINDVSGVVDEFTLRRDKDSQWWFDKVPLSSGGDSTSKLNLTRLIRSLPSHLRITFNRLIIDDEREKQNYHLNQVSMSIQLLDQIYHLQMQTDLPEELGKNLKLQARFRRDFSHVYLSTDGLQYANISRLFDLPQDRIGDAYVSGDFWLNFYQPSQINVSGNLKLTKATLIPNDSMQAVELDFRSRFNVTKIDKRWLFQSSFKSALINGVAVKDFDAHAQYQPDLDSSMDVWVSNVDIESVIGLASRFTPDIDFNFLEKYIVAGRIENVLLSIPADQPEKMIAKADFLALKTVSLNDLPGIDQLNGQVILTQDKARITASLTEGVVNYTQHFPQKFEVTNLDIKATAHWKGSEWKFEVDQSDLINSDVEYHGRLWLEGDGKSDPFMFIRGKFSQVNGSNARHYLPIQYLNQETFDWLDNSIQQARVPSGDFVYHGRLVNPTRFVDHQEGELKVVFDVEQADLNFDPAWPIAKNGSGHMEFHNMGFDILLDQVSYQSMEVATARVSIHDYRNAPVKVEIEADSTLEMALDTWLSLPVGRDFVDIMKSVQQPEGMINSRVGINIPLTGKPVSAEVLIDFRNAAFDANDWGISLTEINGRLTVTESDVSATGLKGRLFGDPVKVDIATDHTLNNTQLKVVGDMKASSLLRLAPEEIANMFDGHSDWEVNLTLPNKVEKTKPVVTVSASSQMRNTKILLPRPFAKHREKSSNMQVDLELYPDRSLQFKVNSNSQLQLYGVVSGKGNGQTSGLVKLDIALNQSLKSSKVDGIRIYGNINQMAVDDWIAFQQDRPKSESDHNILNEMLHSVDLKMGKMSLFGQASKNAEFNLLRRKDHFGIELTSEIANGKINLPFKTSLESPMIVNLDNLTMQKSSREIDSSGLLPSDFIDMDINIGEVDFDGLKFVDLLFETRIINDTLKINNLQVSHQKVKLTSDILWQYQRQNNQQFTTMGVKVNGKNFGRTMNTLRFGDTMSGGKVKFDAQLGWSSSLFDPEWDSLIGEAKLRIDDGVLKDVDPGAGRFVGLLSLNALPRRLALDFGDVFQKGMEFEKIKGNFEIKNGLLSTQNTSLDGTSAIIKIKGDTDLKNRTYNQLMFVTPKVSQTLGVVGSLAIGNAAGWGLFLLQNLFKDAIDDSVEIKYRLTGSWDDPELTEFDQKKIKKKVVDVKDK
jgi:uncharacterized protein (TIGR02099 family)